ncbi:hypothetical protein JVT61DRAFT_1521 [Boletus reticuloceps]|uniref:Uncharacterized protein n=1 Tax=Boletus reticuloceps TaxID=495285 RepID=A0A8I2YBY3_9AGAM|nr:hypothetical protein JVT61DRAFT_1521 [Boletus reticuloceps]
MVEAFDKHWGSPTFTVNHFNSPVSYSSKGFLERNFNSLNPDFISLLCGYLAGASDSAEGARFANPFVKGLFLAKAISTQAHSKNENTIVSAQQPIKPMCTLSTHCKGTVKWMAMLHEDSAVEEQEQEDDNTPNSSSSLTPCVAGKFRAALGTLFETLSETQFRLVFESPVGNWYSNWQLDWTATDCNWTAVASYLIL